MAVDWGTPHVREGVGDVLRVVARYRESGYSIEYGRTDPDRAVFLGELFDRDDVAAGSLSES